MFFRVWLFSFMINEISSSLNSVISDEPIWPGSVSLDIYQGKYNSLWLYKLGLTLWNQSSFEFKYDDTRISTQHKNKIGPIKKNWDTQQGRDFAASGLNKNKFNGPILLLYYGESLVSSNLNSKLFWFHSAHPNVHTVFP